MRVSFYNLGCKVNLADISRLSRQFEDLGYNIVEFEDETDIVLINTCTVTHRADADCRKVVRQALKKSPKAFVGVLGCYAQLQPEILAKIEGVDAVIGTKEKFEVPNLITKFEKLSEAQILVSDLSKEDIDFHTSAVSDNAGRTRAVLKIQDGCDYHCTFCTIPLARGQSRSIKFNKIENELKELNNSGFSEVVLSGINLGDFKNYDESSSESEDKKITHKFIDVVKYIDENDFGMRYRISSIEPNLLKKEIVDIIADSNSFCNHFHIPLQSGSPEILRKMKRRYQTKEYRELINYIKEKMPDCAIGVDVIVGFPGETEEHFAETYEFLNSLPITYLHVFTYSERENTPAIKMGGVVPHDVRKARNNRLRQLSDLKRIEFDSSQLNTYQNVIPEVYNPDIAMWKGWTDNYVSVLFSGPENLEHKRLPIHLNKFENYKMYGELLDFGLDNNSKESSKSNIDLENEKTPNHKLQLDVLKLSC